MINEIRQVSTFVLITAVLAVGWQECSARDSDADIGEFEFEGESVLLPLVENAVHPKVIVDIGNGQRHEFIVDTGASVNVIDSSIAESLGYEVIGKTEIGAPGGPQIPANIVTLPIARIGNAVIIDAEFVTMDVNAFSGGVTQGVLGVGTFSDYLVTFDRESGHIKVSRGGLSANESGVIPYAATDSQIEIDIAVAGSMVAAHVDTGSMGSFLLPTEIKQSLRLQELKQPPVKARVVGGPRDVQFAKLDGTIEFAGFTYQNPDVAFMTPSPGAANIGGRILEEFVLSIDQTNQLIGFQKTTGSSKRILTNTRRRLGIGFRGMPGGSALTIASIEPGSLAESAGLLAGDDLVTLNGRPTGDYERSELGELFGSSAPLRFDIERDGAPRAIEIPGAE